MSTSDIIIDQLPMKKLLTPIEIASACGLLTTLSIYAAIESGSLSAVRINSRVSRISRDEAIRWIRAMESCKEGRANV